MSEPKGESELPRGGTWAAANAGRAGPRLPRLYAPYLVIVGLFGLRGAVQHQLPDDGSLRQAADCLQALGWAMHVVWLQVVFSDAQRHLGTSLPVGPTLAAALAVLFGPFSYVWTAIALLILVESTLREVEERRGVEAIPVRLIQAATNAPALVFAAILWVGVHVFLVVRGSGGDFMLGARGNETGLVDLLGPVGARVFSAFQVGMTAFYLLFVIRVFPSLYRSYHLLSAGGGPEAMDSRT